MRLTSLDGTDTRILGNSADAPALTIAAGSLSPDGSHSILAKGQPTESFLQNNRNLVGQGLFPAFPTVSPLPWAIHWAPDGGHYVLNYSTSQIGFDTYLASNFSPNLMRISANDRYFWMQGWSGDGSMLAMDDLHATNGTRALRAFAYDGTLLPALLDGDAYNGQAVHFANDHFAYPVEKELAGSAYVAFHQFDELLGSSQLLTPEGLDMQDLQYSPDGNWIAGMYKPIPPATQAGTLLIPQANPSAPVDNPTEDLRPWTQRILGWSPDNLFVAVAYSGLVPITEEVSGERLAIFGTDGSQGLIETTSPAGSMIQGLAWSPNGRYLAYTSDHEIVGVPRLYVADLSTTLSAVQIAPTGVLGRVQDFAWSSDSRWLYSTMEQGFNLTLVAADMQSFGSAEVLDDELVDSSPSMRTLQHPEGALGVVYVRRNPVNFSDEVLYVEGGDSGGAVELTGMVGSGEILRVTELFVHGVGL